MRGWFGRLSPRNLAWLIFIVHVLVGAIYSLVVPPWEAHDEWAHYKYVEYLARNWRLPPPGERLTTLYRYDEATQPPLYYVLAAPAVALVGPQDNLRPVSNPYADEGTGESGVNFALHDPAVEGFPYRGTVLALHLARLVSVLVSALGLWPVYLLGRWLFPQRPAVALAAMAVQAFSPQYLFIGAVVTNDILVTALAGWVLYLALRVALGPASWRMALLLGLLLGLALITKYNSLALLPLGAIAWVAALARLYRAGHRRQVWGLGLGTLAAGLAVAGWWFRYSLLAYGRLVTRDPGSFELLLRRLERPATFLTRVPWDLLPQALKYAFTTFWGSFGWGNVGADPWLYRLMAVLCGLGVIGLVWWLVRGPGTARQRWGVALLLLALASIVALPAFREVLRKSTLLRGRYVLPALPTVALLLAAGWVAPWPWQRVQVGMALTLGLLMAGLALATPWLWIAPAYAAPAPITEAEIPERAERVQLRFGEIAELVAFETWPARTAPGKALAVTLYWRVLARSAENYTLGVHALGCGQESYGARNLYPGWGNYATTVWQPGTLFRETYWVRLAEASQAPCLGRVRVAFFIDDESLAHLPVYDATGQLQGDAAILGRFKIAPRESVKVEPLPARWGHVGEAFALADFSLDRQRTLGWPPLEIRFTWGVLAPGERDYTVFVHLLSETGEWAAGADAPPRRGEYPTALWEPGELITDVRTLSLEGLPPGRYQLVVGMYAPETMARLPCYDAAGLPLKGDYIPLAEVEVLPVQTRLYLPAMKGWGEAISLPEPEKKARLKKPKE